jgi:hypothetical protein
MFTFDLRFLAREGDGFLDPSEKIRAVAGLSPKNQKITYFCTKLISPK